MLVKDLNVYVKFVFLIENSEEKIIIDPYDDSMGYEQIKETVNNILVSHNHYDHNYTDNIKLEKNIGMVVIDYLQLIQGSNKRGGSREQEISEISRSLKILAKELDVPVIALSQLSRAAEQRPDHRPMLSDLRESGAIEQDADIVMFLYRDDYYNQDSEKKDIAEIIIAKHRGGSTGTVELLWLGSYTKFVNLERRFDD